MIRLSHYPRAPAVGVKNVDQTYRHFHERDRNEKPERQLVAAIVIADAFREDSVQHAYFLNFRL